MTQPVHIDPSPSGSVAIHLSGELDVLSAPALADHLAAALSIGPDLIVNLREVTFIDAAVIAAILQAYRDALAQNGSLVLTEASPWVEKVLHASRATDVLPLLPNRHPARPRSSPRPMTPA